MDTPPPNSFQPHRSYWPVVIILGVVPNVLLVAFAFVVFVITVLSFGILGFNHRAWVIVAFELLFISAPVFNLRALLPNRRYDGPRVWIAILASGGLVLWGVYVINDEIAWKQLALPDLLFVFSPAFIGISTLAAIAWSRIACGPRLRITLGQFARGTAFGCLLLAAAKWILDYMRGV